MASSTLALVIYLRKIRLPQNRGEWQLIAWTGFLSVQLRLQGTLAFPASLGIVFGALMAAYSNVLIKLRGKHIDPVMLSAGQTAFGLPPLLIGGMITEGSPLHLQWTPMAKS